MPLFFNSFFLTGFLNTFITLVLHVLEEMQLSSLEYQKSKKGHLKMHSDFNDALFA